MVKVKEDLTGRIFGMLKVIQQIDDHVDKNGVHRSKWLCECLCEKHTRIAVLGKNLTKTNNPTRSCGCLRREACHKTNKYSELLSDEYGEYYIGWTTNTNAEFYVDVSDFENIKDYCWREAINANGYHSLEAYDGELKKTIRMHWLFGFKGYDNEDQNPLNNRRHNLRYCTPSQNQQNKPMYKNNTSGVIGVSWDDAYQKWLAQIHIDKVMKNLGRYVNKDDAIKARLRAEKEYYGEFAPQKRLFDKYLI